MNDAATEKQYAGAVAASDFELDATIHEKRLREERLKSYCIGGMDFVRVDGDTFREGAGDFRVMGANCYYLGFASDAMASQVFEIASNMRLNTLRTWAFRGGDQDWTRLDRTIAWAEQRGMRLILPLVNYWDDILGMRAWSGSDQMAFYTEPAVRDAFQAHVTNLLSRVNTFTGRQYRDEPAVLAWELANEPRCENADPQIVFDWAAGMSSAIKSAGAQQLVSLGDEGFFRRWGAGSNGLYNGSHGIDHERLLGIPDIDFGPRWIREHIEAARRASKPAVLEEYGTKDRARRDEIFGAWLAEIEASRGAGSLLWMIAGNGDDGTPYYDDGYTVYSAAEVPAVAARADLR